MIKRRLCLEKQGRLWLGLWLEKGDESGRNGCFLQVATCFGANLGTEGDGINIQKYE